MRRVDTPKAVAAWRPLERSAAGGTVCGAWGSGWSAVGGGVALRASLTRSNGVGGVMRLGRGLVLCRGLAGLAKPAAPENTYF